jgi:DNA-directed RNA polymerase
MNADSLHGVEFHPDGCSTCRRQEQLEQRMRGIGFQRNNCKRCRTDKPHAPRCIDWIDQGEQAPGALKQRAASTAAAGAHMLKYLVDPLSSKIAGWLSEAESGKPGPKMSAYPFLKAVPADAAAYLTTKTILDAVSVSKMEQTVMTEIGRAIEEEARFQSYHGQNPALFDTIVRDHTRRKKNLRRTKLVVALKLRKAGAQFGGWSEQDCTTIGAVCLALFKELEIPGYGPIVQSIPMPVRTKKKYKAGFRLSLCDGILPLIERREDLASYLDPGFLPSVIPPKPWTSPFAGMYWTRHVDGRARRLVKQRNMHYMEELRNIEMPRVYEAINLVQQTAWRINTKVLDVMSEAWRVKATIGKLPNPDPEAIPNAPAEKPPCAHSDDPARYNEWKLTPPGQRWKEWCRSAAYTYEQNEALKSRRIQASKLIEIAESYRDDEALYFPHQLDFRGRVYAVPMFLQPQGPDTARALLEFAEGQPIETEEARAWLAIHGANCYGIDKVSFEDRVKWVAENKDAILRSAADPMATNFWKDADKPWQFLAFCFEWDAFFKHGGGFISHLPVAVDGTCNGLQHFSAMLRDADGGAAVNLTPSSVPQDIYQRVADRTIEILKTHGDDGNFAPKWLAIGIDRKLTKRAVMIVPYGGTPFSGRAYIEDHVRQILGDKHPFDSDLRAAVVFLTAIVWEAIGETVVAAKDAMRWLKKAAREMSKAEMPIVWQTPTGFVVRQAYLETDSETLHMRIGKVRVQKRTEMETEKLDGDRQVTGLSPNFVHSLDASALMESVLASGLTSFAMIHDSYGTHAASMGHLATVLRRVFVDLYTAHNPLEELRQAILNAVPDVKIGDIPPFGSLNINVILESQFYFS